MCVAPSRSACYPIEGARVLVGETPNRRHQSRSQRRQRQTPTRRNQSRSQRWQRQTACYCASEFSFISNRNSVGRLRYTKIPDRDLPGCDGRHKMVDSEKRPLGASGAARTTFARSVQPCRRWPRNRREWCKCRRLKGCGESNGQLLRAAIID